MSNEMKEYGPYVCSVGKGALLGTAIGGITGNTNIGFAVFVAYSFLDGMQEYYSMHRY